MATLTYDPAEQQEGEFTPEEQENIKVGEALEEQQNALLAGKFKDAEDLEKGYLELQRKLGEPQADTEEVKPEEPEAEDEVEEKKEEVDATFLDKLWDEAVNDKYTEDTLKELDGMDPKDLAKMHLQYRSDNGPQEMDEKSIVQLKNVAGGDDGYQTMITWAQTNLKEAEVNMFDKVMERGDPLACYFAIQALKYRYDDASGTEGQMLTGKAPSSTGDTFRSQAEVVRAMKDPKYDNDPAYRQDVYSKLERSNLEF